MYLFMTGYPGFIATRLLRELVKRQKFDKIWLIVLRTPDQRFLKMAQESVANDLADLPVELIEGDITQPNLGIEDSKVLETMKNDPGEWWHLAAVYRLDVGPKVAEQVNVEGTRHVLDLAKQCKQLRRLQYVSTAYVSGDRLGVVKEEELLNGDSQGFKNFYESTKHDAEVLVREAMPELPVTIYRYGVVVGDHRTGETAKFDGPYFLLNFLKRWGKVPVPHVGPMKSKFNMVPVSYVVEASAAIAARDDTVGKTYHITDPRPWTSGEVYRGLAKALGCPRPRGLIPAGLLSMLAKVKPVRKLLGFPQESVVYMNHGADYDSSQAQAVLKQEGIECPEVGSYMNTLVDWYLKNEHRNELRLPVD